MKPVSDTPTEPSDYAAISLVFGSLLAGLAASSRSREPIPRADLVPLSAADVLALAADRPRQGRELAARALRDRGGRRQAPEGQAAALRDRRADDLHALRGGVGAWSALALIGFRLHAPRAGRTVTTVLAASAGNDALQAGFSWLCARANEQSATAEAQSAAIRSEAPRRAA